MHLSNKILIFFICLTTDTYNLSSHASTRFYINHDHYSVHQLRRKYLKNILLYLLHTFIYIDNKYLFIYRVVSTSFYTDQEMKEDLEPQIERV